MAGEGNKWPIMYCVSYINTNKLVCVSLYCYHDLYNTCSNRYLSCRQIMGAIAGGGRDHRAGGRIAPYLYGRPRLFWRTPTDMSLRSLTRSLA